MAKKIIGKCYICKKELTEHDIMRKFDSDWPNAMYYDSKLVCTVHPGVLDGIDKTTNRNTPAK